MGNPSTQARPDVYRYHDYREFFRDWFQYQKSVSPDFTLRNMASQAGLATGYLPMVLSGERGMSLRSLEKILPFMKLNRAERAHLEKLVRIGSGGSQASKLRTFEKLSKLPTYQKRNPNEAEFFRYMSHWYYVAIREMSAWPDFKRDPEWIQRNLKKYVPIGEIREALEFLESNGYILVAEDGSVMPPKETLECKNEIQNAALIKYHKDMFALASDSIEESGLEERELVGFTFPSDPAHFSKAREILRKAMEEIEKLERDKIKAEPSVYQVQLALFPLAKKRSKS